MNSTPCAWSRRERYAQCRGPIPAVMPFTTLTAHARSACARPPPRPKMPPFEAHPHASPLVHRHEHERLDEGLRRALCSHCGLPTRQRCAVRCARATMVSHEVVQQHRGRSDDSARPAGEQPGSSPGPPLKCMSLAGAAEGGWDVKWSSWAKEIFSLSNVKMFHPPCNGFGHEQLAAEHGIGIARRLAASVVNGSAVSGPPWASCRRTACPERKPSICGVRRGSATGSPSVPRSNRASSP